MQYPLISEYLASIRDAKDNLDKLSHLVPVLDKYGEPYRSSGAFAVVFKMKDEQTGKFYALNWSLSIRLTLLPLSIWRKNFSLPATVRTRSFPCC